MIQAEGCQQLYVAGIMPSKHAATIDYITSHVELLLKQDKESRISNIRHRLYPRHEFGDPAEFFLEAEDPFVWPDILIAEISRTTISAVIPDLNSVMKHMPPYFSVFLYDLQAGQHSDNEQRFIDHFVSENQKRKVVVRHSSLDEFSYCQSTPTFKKFRYELVAEILRLCY